MYIIMYIKNKNSPVIVKINVKCLLVMAKREFTSRENKQLKHSNTSENIEWGRRQCIHVHYSVICGNIEKWPALNFKNSL